MESWIPSDVSWWDLFLTCATIQPHYNSPSCFNLVFVVYKKNHSVRVYPFIPIITFFIALYLSKPFNHPTEKMDAGAAEVDKVIYICQLLQQLDMTPKSFITSFLAMDHTDLKVWRGYWGRARGWKSTLELVNCIQQEFYRTTPGKTQWIDYIRDQVSVLVLLSANRSASDQ